MYREAALLMRAGQASIRTERDVASTIAHEMSHLVRQQHPKTPLVIHLGTRVRLCHFSGHSLCPHCCMGGKTVHACAYLACRQPSLLAFVVPC